LLFLSNQYKKQNKESIDIDYYIKMCQDYKHIIQIMILLKDKLSIE
jgi:hypothetical protein